MYVPDVKTNLGAQSSKVEYADVMIGTKISTGSCLMLLAVVCENALPRSPSSVVKTSNGL